MAHALLTHWPEYLIEGTLLGAFMMCACLAVVALEHPRSPLNQRLRSVLVRRMIVGLLMGLTAVALSYSPWGQRSGAHMNPAITLAFLALGKVQPWDALFYVIAQFVGGASGVWATGAVLRGLVSHERVAFAATLPGTRGRFGAWVGEFAIAFTMMTAVLAASNEASLAPFTGIVAGCLVAIFITVEAPLSGMSMNPARTLASAIHARSFRGLWIYFTAPPLAMLCAAFVYVSRMGPDSVYCAKLDHTGHELCMFNCRIAAIPGRRTTPAPEPGIERRESLSTR